VAAVLAYLDAIKKNVPVPQASDSDPRWKSLRGERSRGVSTEETDEFGEEDDEELEEGGEQTFDEEGEDYPTQEAHPPATHRSRTGPDTAARSDPLRDYLEAKSAAELVDLLLALAQRYPQVGEDLREQRALRVGDTDELVEQVRSEIEELTSEPAWQNEWTREGGLPDYSGLKKRFENLLEHGQADALLELGRELLERGSRQVEEAQDEGETASAIGECLEVVFQAVSHSSLPNPQKLLYTIDASLADDYDLTQGADKILKATWPAADWSVVADELNTRLQALAKPSATSDLHRDYRRDRIVQWLIDALDAAGRQAEALAVCEAEARLAGGYERLVRRLLTEGRLDDATRWATEGVEKTPTQRPGVAHSLRVLLREVAEQRKDWPLVAAYRAEEFFASPHLGTLKTLLNAAGQAGCASPVRAAALQFLETGERPSPTKPETPPAPPAPRRSPLLSRKASQRKAEKTSSASTESGSSPDAGPTPASRDNLGDGWPLPPLPQLIASTAARGVPRADTKPAPHFNVLLDLAIDEKRPDDVLAWYDRLQASRSPTPWAKYGDTSQAARVADAVAETHPDRALAIYQKLADDLIAATSPSAYEGAAVHLRKMRTLLHKTGRAAEWSKRLAAIREQNRRKRRLLEVLERLENRPIIEG
jgi:uncharacterized Zn finger protein